MPMKVSPTFHKIRFFILTILVALFGNWSWQKPGWLITLKAIVAKLWQKAKAKPLASFGIVVLLCGISALGWYGYQWWGNRPQPVRIDFAVTEPERTAIEKDEAPNPLVINFNASVAPLDQVGKDIVQGITMKPAISGKWHWLDDKTLEFRPEKDWPVGQTQTIKFDESLVAKQILLARVEFEFTTAKFVASLDKAEFFQDQVDPALKKAIFQLHFTHPVDPVVLKKKITLKLNNAAGNAKEQKALNFTIIYDKLKLNAYIHSEILPVPHDNQIANLTVEEDVKAVNSEAFYDEPLTATITIPGKYYGLSVNDTQVVVTPNPKTQSQDQVLMLSTSLPVSEKAIMKAIKVWQLPEFPNNTDIDRSQAYYWSGNDVTGQILAQSQPIEIKPLPTENDFAQGHSFLIHADVKRTLWVSIDKGLESFGGYLLPAQYTAPVVVPEYPKELQIMGEGSLLTLSGEKKIALMVRDVAGVKIELGRVLPEQLQHLVSQSGGNFGKPEFKNSFGPDNLSERFEWKVPLPQLEKGKAHYQPVDLGRYLIDQQGQDKRGIFFVKASDYKPVLKSEQGDHKNGNSEASDDDGNAESEESSSSEVDDKRLILITDLGIIAKTEHNGSQVVFVQSIQTGQPQAGAEVDIIAKNGLAIMQGTTDADGKVRFTKLSGLENDREPILYLVRHQGDMSFLPMQRSDRKLNFSRFDVGGAENAEDANQLDAYLFSNRGIYRPGDTLHIGMIVKTSSWNSPLAGLPLEAEILDPRGLTVKREKLNLAAGGFNELGFTTLESSATGTYSVNLYTVKDNKSDQLLGHVKVKVEEFQPDPMKIAAKFSKPATEGWLHPKDLQALINVQNLYGAPAESRQVTADLTLQPTLPEFKRYRDYHFHDPHIAKQSYTETLTPTITDSSGNAVLSLGLEKYQGATYRLDLTAQAFEAAGGRSVAAETGVLVSDMPLLVGYKADGALNFVAKDAERNLHFIAIDPQLKQTSADKLTLELLERKVLSVLTKQDDGTYRYESRTKEISLSKTGLTIPQTGKDLRLDSTMPGDYSYVVRDAAGLQLARIDYSVAGQGNVSRSLDREAELQLTLDKTEYAPGDKITVNIRAPYTGAGLITIERDKVYASTWFKADTQSTVQSIEVPKELMGNGYLTVQYMREPGSDEIFMSPLSYGAASFKVSLAQHQQPLTLSVPEHIKPGETLDMKLQSAEPGRVIVFAVDEGILQVARYKNPDPLSYFFQKRQLDVDTAQILDLILPEFKKLMQLSAPGGDGEEEEEPASSLLNPFKRKHDKPAVYWSGIIDLNKETVVHYQVPETFNGSMRVLAVAVTDAKVATAVQQIQVRDDLIITPNAPFMAAPGDEFSVSVALANNIKGSGDKAPVQLKLTVPPQLQVQGETTQTLTIAEGHEGVTTFRIKTQDDEKVTLGNATLSFEASSAGHTSHMHADLSIRPATPRMSSLRLGSFKTQQDVPIQRQLFAQQRKVSAGISPLPLIAVSGLTDYLDNFTHSCTEQLISKAVPALVLSKYPEFTNEMTARFNENDWLKLISVLRSRQNAEGGFGLWGATPQASEFASVYALHMLMEAQSNGKAVPEDMFKKTLTYTQTLAASPANTLENLRVRAYSAYLLTRQGIVTTTMLAGIRESLHNNFQDEAWRQDLTAFYLAASYKLLQQQDEAKDLLVTPLKNLGQTNDAYQFQSYYDPMIRDAQTLYLLAKHFPDALKKLPPAFLQSIAKGIQENRFNTLSSAYFLMAYQAYSDAVPAEAVKQMAITAIDSNGKQHPLTLPQTIAPRSAFPATTQTLRFIGPSNLPLYYAVSESGFDKQLPKQAVQQGLEIQRTYLNAQGKAVDKVKLGEEITVQIRMRAIGRDLIDNIAIQDLLPAGFEVALPSATDNKMADNGNDESALPAWQDRLSTGGNWHSDYADVREDRVLLYGNVNNQVSEYHYKIKANIAGMFTVPPIYAKAMYEPTIEAYSGPGLMKVE
jgi:alpha-2-macroglobulin